MRRTPHKDLTMSHGIEIFVRSPKNRLIQHASWLDSTDVVGMEVRA